MKMFNEIIEILNSMLINLEIKSRRNNVFVNNDISFNDIVFSEKSNKNIWTIIIKYVINLLNKHTNQTRVFLDDLNKNKMKQKLILIIRIGFKTNRLNFR